MNIDVKYFKFILILMISGSSISETLAGDGLITHYSFNAGKGIKANDGTLLNGAGWNDGLFGKALQLNGVDQYVAVKNSAGGAFNPELISVSAWINPVTVGEAHQYIMSKHRNCCDAPGQGGYGLRINKTTGVLRGEIWRDSTASLLAINGASTIVPNTWTHVAMVFDGSEIRLYINGVLDGISVNIAPDIIQPSTKDLTIGILSFNAPVYFGFQGLIDELRLYNRPLPAAEISGLFSAVGGDPALSFYESFDNVDSINANGGIYSGLALSAGKAGNSAEFVTGTTLDYPAATNINPNKGSVSFWFKPNWAGDDPKTHYILSWRGVDANFQILKWYSAGSKKSIFVFRFDHKSGSQRQVGTSRDEPGVVMQWQPGEWQHITVLWDFTGDRQYMGYFLDGSAGTIERDWVLGTLPDTFSLGSTNTGTLTADGAIDELKIYKESLHDLSDPVNSYIDITHNDGSWQTHETIHNSPQDAPVLDSAISAGEDFLFYQTDSFKAVYGGTVPDASAITNKFNYRVAQNEYESLFFNLYSRQKLDDLQLEFTDFVGQNTTIPKSAAQLRVVKNWFQGGPVSIKTPFPIYTPELLVSDDRIQLENIPWRYDFLPSFPVLSGAIANVAAGTSKQFMVTLNVPDGTPPGVYTSTVTVTPVSLPVKTLTLNVEVLPFSLPVPDKDYAIFHRARVDDDNETDYVELDRYQKQVEDIAQHGFNGLTFYGGASNDWQDDKLLLAKTAGLTRTAIMMGAIAPGPKLLMESLGYEPYFYGRDEPNSFDEITLKHIPKSISIHAGGAKVVTAIKTEWANKLKDPNDIIYDGFPAGTFEPLDFTNISFSGSGIRYFHDLIDGLQTSPERETYYWQILSEDPRVNRFFSGYFLWNTGLNGMFPYAYQDVRNNPYDDFDIWSRDARFRDHLVTYPSQEGPIGTVQWESLREGIDDVRYLTKWQQLKDQVIPLNPTLAQSSETVINNMLSKYKRYQNRLRQSISDYSADREIIISEILTLQNFMKDSDSDGIVDSLDNCPLDANPNQLDTNGNGIGDVCDGV